MGKNWGHMGKKNAISKAVIGDLWGRIGGIWGKECHLPNLTDPVLERCVGIRSRLSEVRLLPTDGTFGMHSGHVDETKQHLA